MIGIMFLGAALLWFLFCLWLAGNLPKWLGIKKLDWLVTIMVLGLLLVAPFIDHILGMRQFQKLCYEQTGLQIYPNAVNTKRGRENSSEAEQLSEYFIPIKKISHTLLDLDSGEVIARHYHFTTTGGKIGGLARLGSEYQCTVFQSDHPDQAKYRSLRKQITIIYGETK